MKFSNIFFNYSGGSVEFEFYIRSTICSTFCLLLSTEPHGKSECISSSAMKTESEVEVVVETRGIERSASFVSE